MTATRRAVAVVALLCLSVVTGGVVTAVDAFEPNDDFESATPLSAGTYSDLRLDTGDIDVYAVDLDAGQTVTATVQFSHAAGDLDLYLYNPSGLEVDYGETETDDETVSAVASSSGTYFVEVVGVGDAAATYTLDVSLGVATAPNDAFEPNDDFESATPVGDGTVEALRLLDGDLDFFAVDLLAGESMTVTSRFSHAAGDLDLYVYGPDELERGNGTTETDDEVLTVDADQPGTYYVEVRGLDDATVEYVLVVETSIPDASLCRPLSEGADPPRDLDGDGRCEDVSGDGTLALDDVGVLFAVADRVDASDDRARFDFDDDGDVDIVDVQRLLTLTRGTPTPNPGTRPTAVELTPTASEVTASETTTVDVAVTGVTDGVGAYDLTVRLETPGVARIVAVDVVGDPPLHSADVSDDGTTIRVRAAARETADTGTVRVARVTIQGEAAGETTVSATVDALGDGHGHDYVVTATETASITVREPRAFFAVPALDVPETVRIGERTTLGGTITNTGGATGTQTVELRIDRDRDGVLEPHEVVMTTTVTLQSGESRQLERTMTISPVPPGTYYGGLVTENDSRTIRVVVTS